MGQIGRRMNAKIAITKGEVRRLIDQFFGLQTRTDAIDDKLSDEISDEWTSAMEQYTQLVTRYNSIH